MSTELPSVSVIVPCRNEAAFIRPCLEAILASDYPMSQLEVLVADGRSDDGTRAIVAAIAATHRAVRLLDNPRRITPAALNVAIAAARHDVIVRMDAHALVPPAYLRTLVVALRDEAADIVGGAIDTQPVRDTAVARGIALAMQQPFGMGNSPFRIGGSGRRFVDHVPFFACRRALFERVGGFDEELVRNQDGEFSARVRTLGGRIMLVPEARATYFGRDSLGKLARMFFQYGYYKVLTARKVGRVMTVRQVVPPAFLLALATLAVAAPIMPAARAGLASLLGVYAAAVLAAALRAGRTHRPAVMAVLLAAFPIMHFCYGFGQLRRMAELLARAPVHRADPGLVPLSR